MTAAIIKEFFKLYPEQNNTEAVFNVEATTQFILDLAAANPLDLARFCTWQKSLLSSLSQTEETFIDLLQIIKATAIAQQDYARAELIDKCLQADTPPIPLPAISDIPDASADFHIALFHGIDAAAQPRVRQNLVSDCQYIIRYVEESHKQGSEQLFVDFSNWLLNMIEALGFEKISLIRYLNTIKLHVAESNRRLFDLAIYDLAYPTPVEEQDLSSIKETADIISNKHSALFGFIDMVSTQEHLPKTVADCIKHLEFLKQAIETESPELFKEYIRWADSVLTGLNIETISLIRFLGTMRMVAAQQVSSNLHAGLPYLDAGLQFLVRNLNKAQKVIPIVPLTGLAGQYLTFLLEGNRKGATDFVMKQLHSGMDIKNIYLDIFQRSQYEIGFLWERNKITVAQEHFCTASTQLIMSMLYPHIFSDKPKGKNVVVTCVGSELHELGARMVADFLEMDGWNTYYLGANTPLLAILTSIDQYKADVLAISVTLTPHVKYAKEIIEGIRSSGLATKIVVGGYPFLVDENLWQKIGADGFTKSALELNDELKKLVA
jgi:MerR family transcriptional regulator, light-induced transcriptional regulator